MTIFVIAVISFMEFMAFFMVTMLMLFLNLFHGEERFNIKDYINLISKSFLPVSFILVVFFSLYNGFHGFIDSRSINMIYSYAYTFDSHTYQRNNKWCLDIENNNNEFRYLYGEKGKIYKLSPPVKNKEIFTSPGGVTYTNPRKDLRKLAVVLCKS